MGHLHIAMLLLPSARARCAFVFAPGQLQQCARVCNSLLLSAQTWCRLEEVALSTCLPAAHQSRNFESIQLATGCLYLLLGLEEAYSFLLPCVGHWQYFHSSLCASLFSQYSRALCSQEHETCSEDHALCLDERYAARSPPHSPARASALGLPLFSLVASPPIRKPSSTFVGGMDHLKMNALTLAPCTEERREGLADSNYHL